MQSHPVRFARTLALSTTLVACAGSSEPTPDTTTSTATATPTATATATATPTATATATPNADPVDAGNEGGRISGPLPPPELPA